MKRKPYQFHKPILKWFIFELWIIGEVKKYYPIAVDRYDEFALRALFAMAED